MNAPLSWRSPACSVRSSPIHGLGLFADKSIAAGDIVAIKGGYILHGSTLSDVQERLGPAEVPIADGFAIGPLDASERDDSMLYSNHSCEPNIGVQGQIIFVAMRDIRAGEELTHDWATTDDNDDAMDCGCGAPGCRGTVTGKDWQIPELQRKYAGYFSWYLERKIARQTSLDRSYP